jgi:hypothetical protein
MVKIQQSYSAPWVIDETADTYDGGEDGVSNTYASALYSLDFALYAATRGVYEINFISGGLGTAPQNPYSVIQDDSGYTYGVQPKYAGLYMFSLATREKSGQLLSTSIDAGGLNATAYTIAHQDGSASTVIINKSASNLNISMAYAYAIQSASYLTMTDTIGLSDKNMSNVFIQGAAIPNNGPPTMKPATSAPVSDGIATVRIPAYSAVIVNVAILSH